MDDSRDWSSSDSSKTALRKLYPSVFKKHGKIAPGTFSPLIDKMVRGKASHSWSQLGVRNISMVSCWPGFGEKQLLAFSLDLARLEAVACEPEEGVDNYDCSVDVSIIEALRQISAWGVSQHEGDSLLDSLSKVLNLDDDENGPSDALDLLRTVNAGAFAGDYRIECVNTELERLAEEAQRDAVKDCVLIDGCLAWRVPVDIELLWGSRRTVPEAFAERVGLRPGNDLTLETSGTEVVLSWHERPVGHSLNLFVEALGANEGDLLFLIARPDSVVEVVLRPDPVTGPTDRTKLLRSLGLEDDTEGDMVVHVTEALDLTDADIDLTVIELRERGQSDMADWLLSSL